MKKRTKVIVGIFLVVFIIVSIVFNLWYRALNSALNYFFPEPKDVSLVQLIASPRKYDGRFVRVDGVGCLEFEGTALYLSKDDYKYIVGENSLWLSFYDGDDSNFGVVDQNTQDGDYVLVEGIFNMREKGHYDLHSGAIEKITRYEGRWSRDEY